MSKSIYPPELAMYLEVHGFRRTDQAISEDFMEWQRDGIALQFAGTEMRVIDVVSKHERKVIYKLEGLQPSMWIVAAFVLHSWSIIKLSDSADLMKQHFLDAGNDNPNESAK